MNVCSSSLLFALTIALLTAERMATLTVSEAHSREAGYKKTDASTRRDDSSRKKGKIYNSSNIISSKKVPSFNIFRFAFFK